MTKPSAKAPASKAPAPPAALTSSQRRSLRAQAHHLEPIVQVGHAGVTDGVIAAAREALFAHELIKVRLHEPEDKHGMADTLAAGTGSTLCGLVGHTAILYKKHPKEPRVMFEPAKAAEPAKPAKPAKRERPGKPGKPGKPRKPAKRTRR